ncbi:MAG: acetylglucosamine-6-sulfatase, partial [Planctomycetota bacterium]
DLAADPEERVNRALDPAFAMIRAALDKRLDELKAEVGLVPDRMPLDGGIGTALPDAKIR